MKSVCAGFHFKKKKKFILRQKRVSWSRFASKKHVDFHNYAYSISHMKHTMDIKKLKTIIQGDDLSLTCEYVLFSEGPS